MAPDSKRRSVISYENMSPELSAAFKEKYPRGYADYVEDLIKVERPNGDPIYGVYVELPDAIFLVKIQVKIDDYDEAEKSLFNDDVDDDSEGGEDGGEGFPDEGTEVAPQEESDED